jgi:prolyl 4-hydroxylase
MESHLTTIVKTAGEMVSEQQRHQQQLQEGRRRQQQQQLKDQQQQENLQCLLHSMFASSSIPPSAALPLITPLSLAVTHNLIPSHLQASSLAETLHGTPGHSPAWIPSQVDALTVQDRPLTPPVYNGVNPNYPGLLVVNTSPPIFCVENFLTPFECDFLIHVAQDSLGPAPVVGKGAGEISPSRTSSTCYLAREDLPDVMRKVSVLTGKPIEHCELPQVGRYLPTQQYLQHFDAFDLSTEDGCRFAANGGQRTITVLVYLNDVARGGATRFPALNLDIQPRRGMALVFFPATIDGYLDKMALHAALPAIDTKYVSQVWIRQSNYNGQPSKRLPQTLGIPLNASPEQVQLAQVQQQQQLQLQAQQLHAQQQQAQLQHQAHLLAQHQQQQQQLQQFHPQL